MYPSTDVRIPFRDITLAGTLYTPEHSGPHPAIVMLQGSGPDDRDSGGYFSPIRDTFLETSSAVLSWDKPGVGESTGHWHSQTLFDRADEAMTALAWLRDRQEIDAACTGVWGHSQGGWVAQIVAAEDPDTAFAIINSGPGVDVLEQDLFGVEHTLRGRDASEAEVGQAVAYMERVHAAASEAMPYDTFVRQVMEPARSTRGFDYFGEVDEGLWGFFVKSMRNPYEPVAALERITCPVLAIFGERDTLVPVAKSVRLFEEALTRAGNMDTAIAVFAGADHRIRTENPDGFADGYLETMAEWLRDRVNRSRETEGSIVNSERQCQ